MRTNGCRCRIYRTDSATFASSGWTRATNQLYMQIYMMDVGEQKPDRVVAGFQDRGSWRSWQGQNVGSPNTWASYNGGDGLHTLIDPTNNDIYYGCSQYGSCNRRYDGPGSPPWTGGASISSGTVSQRRNWNAPVVIDPNDPSILYYAGNHVNRSTNYGSSWTNLSDGVDLTGDWTTHGGTFDPVYGNRWGTVTAVSVSKSKSDTIYAGTDTGRLWKTDDLGESWVEFTDKGLPERWVTRVDIDPDDHRIVYATFSGYRNGEDAAHVYKTTDGGDTWANISGNLPNAPVNDIVIDKGHNTVYVGTDVGVYYLRDGGANWKPLGANLLPLVPVLDIRLHKPTDTLYASTFGRGVFKIALTPQVDFDDLHAELDALVAAGGITAGLEAKVRNALDKAEEFLANPRQYFPGVSQLERAVHLLLWQADVVDKGKTNQGDAAGLRALAASIQAEIDDLR